jgi:hypothetical protein
MGSHDIIRLDDAEWMLGYARMPLAVADACS